MRDTGERDARVIVVCGLDFEAAIVAGMGAATVRGPGPQRVADGIEALLARRGGRAGGWAGILSFGCAGATDPSLRPGDCLLASGVWSAAGTIATDRAWSRALQARLPEAREGLLAGLDTPLATSSDKARLWQEAGVCAVDMESHAAVLAAQRHGLPFAACRVVLDPASRSLPACALAAMRPGGGTDIPALLRGLAAAPHEAAALAALALDAFRARRALRRLAVRLGGVLAPPP